MRRRGPVRQALTAVPASRARRCACPTLLHAPPRSRPRRCRARPRPASTGCASPARAASARRPSSGSIREHGSAAAALAALPRIAAEAGVRDYAPASRAEARGRVAGRRGRRRPPAAARRARLPAAPRDHRRPAAVALGARRPRARRAPGGGAGRRPQRLGARLPHGVAARRRPRRGWASSSPPASPAASTPPPTSAALATGTIAAQAGGIDEVYPPENAGLAAEIAAQGLRLSEMPIGPRAARRRTSRAATASSRASPSASWWSRAPCARAA